MTALSRSRVLALLEAIRPKSICDDCMAVVLRIGEVEVYTAITSGF